MTDPTVAPAPPPPSAGRRWRRRLVRLAVLAVGVYLAVAVLFIVKQRSLMYPATKTGPLLAADHRPAGLAIDDVTATTADGLTLHGWYVRPDAREGTEVAVERRPVVLFLHGNGGNRAHRLDIADLLAGLGCEVAMFDYRGYGENPGDPSEAGFATDARAFWDYLIEDRRIPPDRIVIWGESLGGGVAVPLAAEKCAAGPPPAGLILRSTFSSMTDAASHHFPWLPVRLALLDRFDSAARIGGVTCPILALHGDADNVVPYDSGRDLFAAAPRRSATGVENRFVTLPGADHNDAMPVASGQIRAAVAAFLGETFAAGQAAVGRTAD